MSTPVPRGSTAGQRPSGRVLVGVALAVLLVLWVAVNRNDVEVSFILFQASLPLWMALTLAALLGAAAGQLVGRRRRR